MPNINVNESGQVVRVNLQEDIRGADTLNFILEPQLGEKLEKSASDGVVIGTVNVTVDDETYLANQYLEYTISQNDLKFAGSWRLRGEVIFNDPDGVGVQQLADPNFDTDNTTSDGTGSDWSWVSSQWSITSNALRTASGAVVVKTRLAYEIRRVYRFEYAITANDLASMELGSLSFPLTVGSHDVTFTIPVDAVDLEITSSFVAPTVNQFEITPQPSSAKIVSDYKRIEVLG